MSLPLEKILKGKYEILEKIAEGGIGSIYKVRHRLLEEIRVIKVLRPQVSASQELQQRFLQEARAASRLRHPNIARLYDFAIADDGTAYIVMEFIDGVGLDALLSASGPPSIDLSLEIARQSLRAISCLHESGFVHRDISPDNLMLARDYEGRPLVKLIDLGIAKDLGEQAGLTVVGTFLGKIRYCAPEQLSGDRGATNLDQRSDNYSFGVLLYELLTGQYPYRGESFQELAADHLSQPPRDFAETDPEGRVPEALRKVVLAALEKDPEKRIATASEFAERLAPIQNPSLELDDELDKTVAMTTSFLLGAQDYKKPGSTQDRLDQQFGMEATPVPTPTPLSTKSEQQGRTEEPVPAEVNTVLETTMRRLREELRLEEEAGETIAQVAVASEAVAAEGRVELRKHGRGGWLRGRTGSPFAVGTAAALLVLLAAVAGWLIFLRDGRQRPEAGLVPGDGSVAKVWRLVPTERWDPARTSPTELEWPISEDPPLPPPRVLQREKGRRAAPIAAAPAAVAQSLPAPAEAPASEAASEVPLAEPASSGLTRAPVVESPSASAKPEQISETISSLDEKRAVEAAAVAEGAVPPPELPLTSESPDRPEKQEPEIRVGELVAPGPGVVAPRLIRRPSPRYPPAARRLKRHGQVKVRVLVDEAGNPAEVQRVGPKVGLGFDEAALDAAREATWEPATKNGVRVKMWLDLNIVFKP